MSARYRILTAEQQAELTPRELAAYRTERAAFDAEVATHKAHIRANGWLDISRPGEPPFRFFVGRIALPATVRP